MGELYLLYFYPLISCSHLIASDLTSSTAQMKPTEHRMVALLVKNEFELMWKDDVADKHRHLTGKKTNRTNYFAPGWNLNRGPPKYAAGALPTEHDMRFFFYREAGPSHRISCPIPVYKKSMTFLMWFWRHLILRTQIPPNLQTTFYIFTARNTTRSNHCIILLSSWWWAVWCPKHVEQAIRSAIKTSVASSWHFIST